MNIKRFTRNAIFFPLIFSSALANEDVAEKIIPDEIVVSGYRPVSVSEMGASITVVNTATLDSALVENFQEVVQRIPNMNFSGEASRPRYFQIRGIGEREQYEGAPNPSVGFIVDDIDLSGIGGVISTFDLERIEVLRGPQSARYGSSALAGIVYAESRVPTSEIEGRVEVTGASDATRSLGAAVGGPLTSGLSGRLSVYKHRSDGFLTNAFLGRDDTNERDELTVRGKLNWDFGAEWAAQLVAMYADFDNGYDAFSLGNSDTTLSDEPGEDSQKTKAAALRVGGPLNDAIEFLSISSVASSDVLFSYDGDWVNEQYWLPIVSDYRYTNPRQRDAFSQELRLLSSPDAKLFNYSTAWVAGVSYQALDEDNVINSTGEYVEAAVGCDPGFCITDRQINSAYSADNFALFGVLDSQLSDGLELSIGLRVEQWDAEYTDLWTDNGVVTGAVSASNQFAPDETMVGGHVTLSYDWTDSWMSYARIARGFKAGGFNPSLAALSGLDNVPSSQLIAYEPEYLWNYELGVKLQSPDGSFLADANIFYMDRDNAQLSQSSQVDPVDPNTFFFITNNGEAQEYGLESSFAWQAGDAFRFHGAFGWLESEIDAWAVRSGVVGRDLAHAPNYTLSLGVTWEGGSGWNVKADVIAIDGFYFDISHDQKSESYQLLNLSVGKSWDSWSASVWGKNIFDETYATRGFFFGNEPPNFSPKLYMKSGDPQQVGLTVAYAF